MILDLLDLAIYIASATDRPGPLIYHSFIPASLKTQHFVLWVPSVEEFQI